jgi:hypothetical protein
MNENPILTAYSPKTMNCLALHVSRFLASCSFFSRLFLLSLAAALTSFPLVAQEKGNAERLILTKNELRSRFEEILPPIAEIQWEGRLQSPNFQMQDLRSFMQAVRGVRENVNILFASEEEWNRPVLASFTTDYVAFNDLYALRETQTPLSRTLFERVSGAAYDLRAKAQAFAKGKKGMVDVSIRTLKRGTTTEESDCYVWYAPYFDDRSGNWERLQGVSSPAKGQMPVGIWSVWAVKGNLQGKRERLNLEITDANPFDIDAP